MESQVSNCSSGLRNRRQRPRASIRAAAMWLALLLCSSGTAWAQSVRVSGTVTSPGGQPVVGAVVRVVGGDSAASTNDAGRYTVGAPPTGTLSRWLPITTRAAERS